MTVAAGPKASLIRYALLSAAIALCVMAVGVVAGSSVDCRTLGTPNLVWDAAEGDVVDTSGATLYVLNLFYSVSEDTGDLMMSLTTGALAALEAAGNRTASGAAVRVVDVRDYHDEPDEPTLFVNQALCLFGDRLTGVLGPYGDDRLENLMATNVLRDNDLVAFGPFTASSAVRYFSKNVYFMRPDPMAELFTILNHVVNRELHIRVAFLYLEGSAYGEYEINYGRAYLEEVGSGVVAVYKGHINEDEVDEEAFQALVEANPQSLIVLMPTAPHTSALLQKLLVTDALFNATIAIPSALTFVMEWAKDYVQYMAPWGYKPINRRRVFSSAIHLPAHFTHVEHIHRFREDYFAYLEAMPHSPMWSPPGQTNLIDSSQPFGEAALGGWATMQVLLDILRRTHWVQSRAALIEGVFEQNRYLVAGDYLLGDYGGVCRSAFLAEQGTTCECNQGGSTVYLLQHEEDFTQTLLESSTFSYRLSTCYAHDVHMPYPVNMITAVYQDDDSFAQIAEEMLVAGQNAVASLNGKLVGDSPFSYNMRIFNTHVATAQEDLDAYLMDHRVDVIVGAVLLGMDTHDTLIVSPTYNTPHASWVDPNKVSISPTLEQQFYVLCAFLQSAASAQYFNKQSQLRIIMRGVEERNVKDVIDTVKKTTRTFKQKTPKITQLDARQSLAQNLDKNTVTFLVGMRRGDPEVVLDFLEQSSKNIVILLFQDYMLFRDEIEAALETAPQTVRPRLVFCTSFPIWTDTSAEAYQQYPILKSFHEAVGDPQFYTPRALEVYLAARLVQAVASSLQTISATELRDQLYHTSVFLIDDLRLGPFVNCEEGEKDCVMRNYGAANVYITSAHSVASGVQDNLFGPVTPAMTYSKPLTTNAIVAIAVCGGIALIAAIVLPIVICMCCCSSSRDNKHAPKKVEDPVTIIFTDIESSTALWGTVPQLMPDAVATHHRIIREIIAAHHGYEVKTVGDSFMIACKKPFAAVQIAQDIQKRFLAHDWEEEIDECYRQFEQRKADDPDNETYKPHSANLVRSVYEALWGGLRVRIGVHTGLSDIRQDEITGGFDYYGETSNMAARTEAIGNGGQVLLTDSTWWALSQDERDSLDVTNLGRQGLRGVGWLVEMFQLNSVAMRAYPPLRLEVDAYLPNDDETQGSMSTDGMASSVATLTGPAAAIATVLTNCFSPYPPARRIKELQPLLQKWGIPVPPRHRRVAEEDYCQGLLNRLAVKMSSVVQIHDKAAGLPGSTRLTPPPTTSTRGFPSLRAIDNPLVKKSSGLNTRQVSRLRRSSRQSTRSGHKYFADTESPVRSTTPSLQPSPQMTPTAELVEMFPSVGSQQDDRTFGSGLRQRSVGEEDALWTVTVPAQPPRGRRAGLAALSTTSEANSSVHVSMPLHFE